MKKMSKQSAGRDWRRGALVVACAFTAAATGVANAAGAEARKPITTDGIYDLTLRGAETNAAHLLRVCLRAEAGKFTAGVTVGPLGPTEVDCSGLAIDGNGVSGVLKATVGFDGYFPKDGKPVVHEYRLTARVADGVLSGTYEGAMTPGGKVAGAVEGALSAPPDLGGYWVMDLQMENGAGTGTLGAKSYETRVHPKLFLKDGKTVQSLIYGRGGRAQINYFESAIATNALRFDGKTLAGSLAVKPTGGPLYVFVLDGVAVGTQIGGVFRKMVGGEEHTGGPFHGKLQPMAERPLNQSLHYLELHGAVVRTWDAGGSNALQLMAFAPCTDGKFGTGLAYAGAWNHVYHDVDASGLKLDGAALAGELKVTLNPDPYMPPDHKPVSASYKVSATVADGRIVSGTFTGACGGIAVSGPVFGELMDQPPVPEPVSVHVKLEDGVNGGAPWFRRTYVGFTAVNGKADKGSMSNNKGGWKGTFRKAEVKFDGAAFSGTIDGTVDETKGPEKGAYTFKLTGRVIGTELVGRCDTYREGKLTKSGTPFMGGIGAGAK